MGTEIERKFLVKQDLWQPEGPGTAFRQGYLATGGGRTVRVRVAGDQGFLTIKGPTTGLSRAEYEYAIPLEDAAAMLDTLCLRPFIEKTRHLVPFEGETWEVDVFHGDNAGLVVAELELSAEDAPFAKPAWLGEEVSHDPRYYNANLIKIPYKDW